MSHMYVIFGSMLEGVIIASGTSIFISYTFSGMFSTGIFSSMSSVLELLDPALISEQLCPQMGHFSSLEFQYSKSNWQTNIFKTIYCFPYTLIKLLS